MKNAKMMAEYLSVALAAAGVDARLEPGMRDGQEVVDVHEDGGGFTTVVRSTASVAKRTIGTGYAQAEVELWAGHMDMGPQQWHPEEPPTDAGKYLGTWEGVARAALELTVAIVRQRVADKLAGFGMARAWEEESNAV